VQSGRKIPHFFPGIEGFHVIAEGLVASCLEYPVSRSAHPASRKRSSDQSKPRLQAFVGGQGVFLWDRTD